MSSTNCSIYTSPGVGGGTDVYLAVYDLSKGMARGLSQQFLGVAIDIIPHTGLVVFGKEWFFGGGIQAVEPNVFRSSSGMQPIQTIRLGRTTVRHDEFERWCRSDGPGGRGFHPSSYDLLQKNCNHFSHEAALQGLRLPQGVPDWILDVPRRFLSSPMGQIVRPMLEQMQVTRRPAVHGHGAAGIVTSPSSNPSSRQPSTTQKQPTTQSNPWANVPSQKIVEPTSTNVSSRCKSSTILNKYRGPMLSNDKSTLQLCKKKLSPFFVSTDERIVKGWEGLCWRMENGPVKENTDDGTNESSSDIETINASLNYLWTLLRNPDNDESIDKLTIVILLFMRLVVLDSELNSINLFPTEESPSSSTTTVDSNICWMINQMRHKNDVDNAEIVGWKSPPTRSMAWCLLSNVVTCPVFQTQQQTINDNIQRLVDAALVDVSPSQQPKVELRQAASAFLYNVTLLLQQPKTKNSDDDASLLDDIVVSILCSNLDGSIEDETDETTRFRRLLVVARIISPTHDQQVDSPVRVNRAAKSLLLDLGFEDFLKNESDRHNSNECRTLARELLALIH